jgi:hypothetical protein
MKNLRIHIPYPKISPETKEMLQKRGIIPPENHLKLITNGKEKTNPEKEIIPPPSDWHF